MEAYTGAASSPHCGMEGVYPLLCFCNTYSYTVNPSVVGIPIAFVASTTSCDISSEIRKSRNKCRNFVTVLGGSNICLWSYHELRDW